MSLTEALSDEVAEEAAVRSGECTTTSDGGEFKNVVVEEEVHDNFDHILRKFGLNPDHFEIIDDTVRCTTWQQSKRLENGDRDTVNLYSYSGRFRKTPAGRLAAVQIEDHLKAIRKWKAPRALNPRQDTTPCAAVFNLADIQGGKSEGGGVEATAERMKDGLDNAVEWLIRMVESGRNVNEVVLVNNGDPYEGCAGNYASQLFTVEMTLRDQMKFVLDIWSAYAKTLFPMVGKGQFVSVLCNHTEMNRLGGSKNQTSDSDSGGAFLAEVLRMILSERPEFDHVQWTIPHDEMNVYAEISGVPVGFNHGHKIPGNGDATAFERWLNGQVRGNKDAANARLWFTAHRHNFQAWDLGNATGFMCPSMDGGSKWLRDMTGKFSRSGILALLVGEHDKMGWSDLAFL